MPLWYVLKLVFAALLSCDDQTSTPPQPDQRAQFPAIPMYPPYGGEPLTAGSRYGGLVVIAIVALSVPYQKPGAFGLSGRAAASGAASAASGGLPWLGPGGAAGRPDRASGEQHGERGQGQQGAAGAAGSELGALHRGDPSGRAGGWAGGAALGTASRRAAPAGHILIFGELPANNTTLPSYRGAATQPGWTGHSGSPAGRGQRSAAVTPTGSSRPDSLVSLVPELRSPRSFAEVPSCTYSNVK